MKALARQLVDAADAGWPALGPGEPTALAWALKDLCYEAWSRAPPDAVRAAARLAELAAAQGDREIAALADWAAAIAALTTGHMAEAVAQLDRAHRGFVALGRAQPAAETRVPKIVALAMLGRDDEALACAEDALAQFVSAGDERAAGKVELNMGTMLSRRDRHGDAAQQYRRAAVRFARVGDLEHSIMADIGLANALTWQYDFDEALRIDQRARMRAEAHGFAVLRAHAHGAIGRIELNRGRTPQALRELATACRLLDEAGAAPQRRIEAESALADGYLAAHLLPEAVALYERVIAEAEAFDAPTERAWATLQRARAQAGQGAFAAALDGLVQARALYVAQDNAASVALCDLALAATRLASGDAAGAAAQAAQAAAALADGIPGWRLEAQAIAAAAAAAQGDDDGAAQAFGALLAAGQGIAQTTLAARHGLGVLAWRRGDAAAAREHLGAALALVDALRAALPGDAFRSAAAAGADGAHDLLVEIALAEGDPPERVFDEIERGRARALAIALGEGPRAGGAGEAVARTRLQWTRERLREALAEGDDDAIGQREREVAAQESALLEAHRRALLLDGEAAPAAGLAPACAADVQAALGPGEALVAFHRLGSRWCAVVVTREGLRCIDADAGGLDERLQGLRFQIDALRLGGSALAAHAAQLAQRARAHLQALHRLVWAPLGDALAGIERVAVVPHRALHYVPFAALHDGTQWLLERHEVRVLPSASAWLAGRRRAAGAWRQALVVGSGDAALPEIEAEVDAVAAAFAGRARVLRGAAATQAALRDAASGADLLHIACHGRFRADSPSFSALELADGPLALHDLAQLPLDARLVVLSACETGLSRIAPGDELIGLVRGFLTAGAGAVLATLWAIDDASTAVLMRRFYAQLTAGDSPAAALRAAQRELALAGVHPFRWGAFTLHGQG